MAFKFQQIGLGRAKNEEAPHTSNEAAVAYSIGVLQPFLVA